MGCPTIFNNGVRLNGGSCFGLNAGATADLNARVSPVPSDATAVLLKLSIRNDYSNSGYVKAYPRGGSAGIVFSVDPQVAGKNVSNVGWVNCDSSGYITVQAFDANFAMICADVLGYMV